MRRPFVDTLRDVRAGEVIEQLDAELQHLVQQVMSTNKGGQLKLLIDIAPMKGSTEAVVVKAEVKCQPPVIRDSGTVLFPTPEGNLQRSYYRQPDLPGISLATPEPRAAEGRSA